MFLYAFGPLYVYISYFLCSIYMLAEIAHMRHVHQIILLVCFFLFFFYKSPGVCALLCTTYWWEWKTCTAILHNHLVRKAMSTDEHITDPAPPSRLVRLESLNREFEQFISEQNESRKSVVWRQVNRAIWRQLSRRVSVVVLCSCLAVLLVSYIPQLNWSAAAVGRMALIQVLPYWNWTHYHRDRCIWEKKKVLAGSSDSQFKDASCHFCESIGISCWCFEDFWKIIPFSCVFQLQFP